MSTSSKPGFHHVAYACRDIDATHQFYEELMGFHLVHTEVVEMEGGFFRHTFYDTGDGSCLAFFDIHGVGEKDDWDSAISTGNGLPVWVNHVAFSATEEKQNEVKERMELARSKGSFWQDYKFTDPVSKKIEPKSMYCERLDDSVVCGGIYR